MAKLLIDIIIPLVLIGALVFIVIQDKCADFIEDSWDIIKAWFKKK
jgi:hypothetical protein